MKEEFIFTSSNGKNNNYAVKWTPKDKPKYILQIAHGMAEHILRYEDFAKFLNEHGFLVCGEDHLGHGRTAPNKNELGYFAEKNGHQTIVKDMKKLYDIVSAEYPDVPYFLMGHSMGSFLCREFLETYGRCLSGAIVMGTGEHFPVETFSGKLLCKVIAAFRGWHYRSQLINKIAVGNYNKRFKPIVSGHEWLTRDESKYSRYEGDPYCGYVFTLNGFWNMFDMLAFIRKPQNIDKVPKTLPILICSGGDDPVGAFGKSPKIVFDAYQKAGIEDVKLEIYPKDRHEILNELDNDQVYDDILNWLVSHA